MLIVVLKDILVKRDSTLTSSNISFGIFLIFLAAKKGILNNILFPVNGKVILIKT